MCLRRSDGTLVDPDFLRRNVLIRRWIRPESIEGFGRTDSIFSGTREAQLSHARLSTTSDVYVHTNDDDLKKAAEALAGTVQKFLPTTVPTN
ncbi:MAG: hypothetical protein DMG15_06610 [Acidobacteria bacterium]|nr:MAG: hypothetical protein DMG16_28955 [Acidobacteriota bacterium]PYS14856.1 MAG: hypothetical protein DMG15_06610 [Acidobacteriota bacterium]